MEWWTLTFFCMARARTHTVSRRKRVTVSPKVTCPLKMVGGLETCAPVRRNHS